MSDEAAAPWRGWTPGVRVVVRRVRDDLGPDGPRPGEPPLTDVVGVLLAVDDAGLLVRTRRGDVRVPAADVVVTKIIPEPPPRRRPRPT